MFSEVADGNSGNIQPYIRRDLPNKLGISTSDTTVKGNRDALDFPLFWRMVDNLTSNGTAEQLARHPQCQPGRRTTTACTTAARA